MVTYQTFLREWCILSIEFCFRIWMAPNFGGKGFCYICCLNHGHVHPAKESGTVTSRDAALVVPVMVRSTPQWRGHRFPPTPSRLESVSISSPCRLKRWQSSPALHPVRSPCIYGHWRWTADTQWGMWNAHIHIPRRHREAHRDCALGGGMVFSANGTTSARAARDKSCLCGSREVSRHRR